MSAELISKYLQYLKVQRNLSDNTIKVYKHDLLAFSEFVSDYWRLDLLAVDQHLIRDYLAVLHRRGLKNTSIAQQLSALRSFYAYLQRFGHLEANPTEAVKIPKRSQHLPQVLSVDEMELLLSSIVGDDPLILRDRAIFELLYASGIRVGELVSLDLNQLDLEMDFIRVYGKGRRERIVPIGEYANEAMLRYLENGRPRLCKSSSENAVFVNNRGKRLTARGVQYLLNKRIDAVAITKKISPHSLRHIF